MQVDHPSSGPSQVAVAQSVSPGQMFQNATSFGVHGSQFMSVQGNVNIQPSVPHFTTASTVLSGPHQLPQSIVPSTPSPQATVYSESGNYCSQLLRQGRGTPLYVPGPQVNLPAEYRRRGVAIGDVGRITPEGSFDFFFNIYLPANHRINANIPEDFVPLSPYDSIDVAHYYFNPGNYVCSPSVNEINRDLPEFPGGEFVFNCGGPSGAVLTLPNGAHLEKLENLENMRRYAARHAESWYKYVNETRGRGLANGSLYLVTGWEKADSWGMASYHNVSLQNEFQLLFRPTADAANGHRYRWQGPHCRRKHADPPPVDETPLNQTTFIHAFAISVCENIWGKLFGVEVCQPADSSTFQDKPGRGFIPYGSRGSSFGWSFFFGSSYSEEKQNTRQAPVSGNGMISDASPIPKIIHPSEIIHERILREAPTARVVITHDDDWRDVFIDDGIKRTGQNFSELQQAIFDRFEIMEEDGAVFLVAKSHMNLVKDDATMTIEEPCKDITTDAPSDNPGMLSETAPLDMATASDLDIAESDLQTNSGQLDPQDLAYIPDAFTTSPWAHQSPANHPTRSRSASYNQHNPSAFIDHILYTANQQEQPQFFRDWVVVTSDTHGVDATHPQQLLSDDPHYISPARFQPEKANRQRIPEPAIATNDDETDNKMDPKVEEEGRKSANIPEACARCKSLKVKCEFKTETDPCKRCFNGGHECVIPSRKKRGTPPKREHLLHQIREQAAEIQKLMTQLEETNARQLKPPSSATIDSFPLTPSSTTPSSSYFASDPSSVDSKAESENNRAVEDWIAKARDSLAEFDSFIAIGGAGMPISLLVTEDLEDSASEGEEEEGLADAAESSDEQDELLASEGEEVTQRRRRDGKKLRQLSTVSNNTNGGPNTANGQTVPKKKDSGGEKLATLPSEASPFGLMADLSLKNGRAENPDDEMEDESAPALGVANINFFRSSAIPDPMRSRPLSSGPAAPHILTRGLITPQEAEKLFDIYFQRMNLSVSLLDPVLYTPQKTCYRSPFLFTVVCGIASRFYTERPGLYSQAMHFVQRAAGTALTSGHKCVELCQGYILMSLYPVPAKLWEEERGWLYLGLAIRMATDLNLHRPNTAQPINEFHAREMLNRTRVWLNCFNLDRSIGSQYGKAPTIPNSDYMANHSYDWWRRSPYNMQNFDIYICAENSELKVMAAFMATIYSDPNHPTGLNKNIDFEEVASNTDEELKQLEGKWRQLLEQMDMADPQNRFRSGLLKLAYSYARLVVLSFGFRHTFRKDNLDGNPFLNRCFAAASDVVKALVEDVGTSDQRIYLRHGPITQSVFVTFAASTLVKLLQPKFTSYLTIDKRQQIRGMVKQVIDLLASPDVSIDDKHGPNLYARFLEDLLKAPEARAEPKQKRRPMHPNSGQSLEKERNPAPSSHISPDTSHSFSAQDHLPPTHAIIPI